MGLFAVLIGEVWCRRPSGCLAVALALALGGPFAVPARAAESDAALKQSAQYFADMEDDKAKAILDDLSAQGIADADVLLGYLYSDPLYAGRDERTAVSHFERAAAAGNPEAIFQLAESKFWPGYRDSRPGEPPQILGVADEETYRLLQRAVKKGHSGARFRFAMLCVFGGYSCTEDEVKQSLELRIPRLRGGLGAMSDPFSAIRTLTTGEDSFERTRSYHNYLEVGLSFVNPLVATVWGSGWQHVTDHERCPSVHHPSAVNRMFAAMNGVARPFPKSLTLDDCYDAEQQAVLREKVLNMLDGIVTMQGTYQVDHINWCYRNRQGRAAAACLVTATIDQFFSCYRLSLQTFLERYGIDRGPPLLALSRAYVEPPRAIGAAPAVIGARQG